MGSKQLLLVLALAGTMSFGIKAQTDIDKAKAVYIYNFLSHIMWQDNTNEKNIVIGVIGSSDVYDHLKSYTANRKVGSKSIDIIKVNVDNGLLNCHVVFISRQQSKNIIEIKKIVAGRSCLLIGDRKGMTDEGATISFIHQDYKLKYKLSEANATANKLVVSKALKVMSL